MIEGERMILEQRGRMAKPWIGGVNLINPNHIVILSGLHAESKDP